MPASPDIDSPLLDVLLERYSNMFHDQCINIWDIWGKIHLNKHTDYKSKVSIEYLGDPIKVVHTTTKELIGTVYINDPELFTKLDKLVSDALNSSQDLPKLEI